MKGKQMQEEIKNYLRMVRAYRKEAGITKVPEFDERDIKLAYGNGLKSGLWHHSHDYLVKTAGIKKEYMSRIAELEAQREKQIQIDAEQILALQKQNGELTDKVKELEQQIEKMKCCENCGWFYLQQHWRESKEINESRMFHCGTCGYKRNWKIKEIKENE